jgi:hypothetical protein
MWLRLVAVISLMIMASFLVGFSGYAFAQVTRNITVDVNIASVAEITISPTFVAWTLAAPGANAGIRQLSVKNTGSTNITNMFAYVDTITTETVRPYGATSPANYSAGGLLTLNNQSGFDQNFSFVGRLEWNHTQEISNIVKTGVTNPASAGWYRNNSNEYVWLTGANTTNFRCNETTAQFAIEDDIDDGSASTRTPSATGIEFITNTGAWGIFAVNRTTAPLYQMCVAVNATCDKIFIYKYDKRTDPNFGICTNSRYVRATLLPPNQIESVAVNAYVPRGIPVGDMTQASLTFAATSS